MKNRTKVAIAATLGIVLGVSILGLVSARKARLACDRCLGKAIADMPHFSTRITFHPEHYLKSRQQIPVQLGWIVSYANSSGDHSIGFLSDLHGNVRTSGMPVGVPVVALRWANMRAKDQEIVRAVEEADRLTRPGMSYSDIIAALGPPMTEIPTDGTLALIYDFGGPNVPDCFLTNGIEVVVSNGIVTGKSYQYGYYPQ